MVKASQDYLILTQGVWMDRHQVLRDKVSTFLEGAPESGSYSLEVFALEKANEVEGLSKVTIREALGLDLPLLAFVRRGPGWYRAVFLEGILHHQCSKENHALLDVNADLRERLADAEDALAASNKSKEGLVPLDKTKEELVGVVAAHSEWMADMLEMAGVSRTFLDQALRHRIEKMGYQEEELRSKFIDS